MRSVMSMSSAYDSIRTAPQYRIRRPRVATLALLALIIIAPPTYLAQTSGALTTSYNIQRLKDERDSWNLRNQQLELELAKARSLAWIESEATSRLGMQRSGQASIVHVDVTPPTALARPDMASRTPRIAPSVATRPAGEQRFESSWVGYLGAFLAELLAGR